MAFREYTHERIEQLQHRNWMGVIQEQLKQKPHLQGLLGPIEVMFQEVDVEPGHVEQGTLAAVHQSNCPDDLKEAITREVANKRIDNLQSHWHSVGVKLVEVLESGTWPPDRVNEYLDKLRTVEAQLKLSAVRMRGGDCFEECWLADIAATLLELIEHGHVEALKQLEGLVEALVEALEG
mmetsp:Transcript_91917/g.213648  ORF Transcript_91917/g.213648 Transcript_91917/m.213648 type:complete len:180 (-) Transcript_91917:31-570(-)